MWQLKKAKWFQNAYQEMQDLLTLGYQKFIQGPLMYQNVINTALMGFTLWCFENWTINSLQNYLQVGKMGYTSLYKKKNWLDRYKQLCLWKAMIMECPKQFKMTVCTLSKSLYCYYVKVCVVYLFTWKTILDVCSISH